MEIRRFEHSYSKYESHKEALRAVRIDYDKIQQMIVSSSVISSLVYGNRAASVLIGSSPVNERQVSALRH